MKLYTHAAGPRRNEFYTATTPTAAAYTLQQQLLEAYTEVLYTWWCDDELIPACFGDALTKPTRKGTVPAPGLVKKRANAIEDRLGYEVPELIERMSQPELEAAVQVFCEQTLVGFIWHVLKLERTIQHRLDEPHTCRLKDQGHAKACGLGKGAPMKKVVVEAPVKKITPAPAPVAKPQRPAPKPVLRVNRVKRQEPVYNPHHPMQLWLWPLAEVFGVSEREAVL